MCRQVVSLNVEPCIEEYDGEDGAIVMPRDLAAHAGNVQLAMLAALHSLAHAARIYELSAAVSAALASPPSRRTLERGRGYFSRSCTRRSLDSGWAGCD
jgi:hypothetical protein